MLLFVCFRLELQSTFALRRASLKTKRIAFVQQSGNPKTNRANFFNSLSITMLWRETRVPLNNSWVVKAPFDTPSVDLDSKSTRNLETQHRRYSKWKWNLCCSTADGETGFADGARRSFLLTMSTCSASPHSSLSRFNFQPTEPTRPSIRTWKVSNLNC